MEFIKYYHLGSKFHYTTLFFTLWLLAIGAGVYYGQYSTWWLLVCIVVYITILALGSIFIQWNFYLKSVNHLPLLKVQFDGGQFKVNNRGKQVVLTFDDGPAAYTTAILDILKKEKVKAVFFLIGKNIAGNENLVQRMKAEGHQIGGHSYFHGNNFDWQSTKKMQLELENTNAAIEKITGEMVSLFRPPYGVTTPNLAKAIHLTDQKSIGWNLRSLDTVAKDGTQLTNKVLAKLKPGSIILLHDRCAITAQILPQLIQEIRKRGYDFATL